MDGGKEEFINAETRDLPPEDASPDAEYITPGRKEQTHDEKLAWVQKEAKRRQAEEDTLREQMRKDEIKKHYSGPKGFVRRALGIKPRRTTEEILAEAHRERTRLSGEIMSGIDTSADQRATVIARQQVESMIAARTQDRSNKPPK